MRSTKSSFVLYHDIRGPLELLTVEQRGLLFTAILDYSEFGKNPAFDDAGLSIAFAFIKNALDRDTEAWKDKQQKRADAGSKGGQQTAANRANAAFAKQNKQTAANQAVPVPVPSLANVPDPVNVLAIDFMADKPPRTRFEPPSLEEIKAYCKERGNGVDAQRFFDYYEANGWVQGKGKPIRDWKAALRTWERNEKTDKAAPDLPWRQERSFTPDDMVEDPPGSGQYRLREEVGACD